MSIIKEFFGWGGYTREPEGYFSWQHILFVTCLLAIMAVLAVILGKQAKRRGEPVRERILVITAVVLLTVEAFKLAILYARSPEASTILHNLPLFLCSIQSVAIPVAAFSHGRIKHAALDFILIFGILGAIMGTYFAGQNYGCYPVLCFDNLVSGLTHSIAGFCSLYIAMSGLVSMKKRNIPFTFAILLFFCGSAAIANELIDYNYMFMVRGDGTPYDILYNFVGGNPILYPIGVVLLFILYILAFYGVYFLIQFARQKKKAA